ncbi:MAG: ABC transporter ATP-binding protein [Nitrospinota bacterium]|mgnify:CR=1 FL=1
MVTTEKGRQPCDKVIDYSSVAVYCSGITKTYGSGHEVVHALNGINLEIYPGELMMLVGPSGCGKTTLISIMAGILDQNDGECLVFGHNYRQMSEVAKTRYRGDTIGFVFQAYNLIPTLTAAENVAVPLLIRGMKRKEAIEKARETLNNVGLADRAKALPADLSGGQQQRVAIARSLVHDPKLIVCDEPTSALDHETGYKVMELLGFVAVCSGRSLVIVTHDARIFSFADRIARMDDGKIIEVANSPDKLTKN